MIGTFTFKIGNFDNMGLSDSALAQAEALVNSKISEHTESMIPTIQNMIDNSLTQYTQSSTEAGHFDDTRVFETKAEFPKVGIEDVLYIDRSTGYQYTWNTSTNEYEEILTTMTDEAVESIFN